jgi:UDP-N-acetylglucosamine 2-epimerase (non-hydrolysing)
MRIASVVGARPNFIKLAPIHNAIRSFVDHIVIHTGQHYDYTLSEIFFKEFNLPKPDFNLDVGSATPGFQLGEMIKRLERVFLENKHNIDLVLVYGDTNSTFAGALAAETSGIGVAHVESGLRSFDRRMPEETNRILTDHISDYLFAPTQTAINNLEREHVSGEVVYTGDIAVEIVKEALELSSNSLILSNLQLRPQSYILFTIHRMENTSSKDTLISIIRILEVLSQVKTQGEGAEEKTTIVFPIHPRTENLLREKNLYDKLKKVKNVKLIQPVGYIDFIKLMQNARKIITDSGGVQKEAYLLGVPCITIRRNTEWVETVNEGWNVLTDIDAKRVIKLVTEWMPTGPSNRSSKRASNSILGHGETSTIIKDFIHTLEGQQVKRTRVHFGGGN